MQGRITLVTKMNAIQTLSMIEEAAGTRMYENKKAAALRTLEKKSARVDEIQKLLSEEITPTLEKLGKERASYMQWVSNNNEIERLTHFCLAYEYMQYQGRLDGKNNQLQEAEALLVKIVEEIKALRGREQEINVEMKERTESRDKQKSSDLKKLEDEHAKASQGIASTETKLKNKEADLESLFATFNLGFQISFFILKLCFG
jgi:structural maintenance of chromosome 2